MNSLLHVRIRRDLIYNPGAKYSGYLYKHLCLILLQGAVFQLVYHARFAFRRFAVYEAIFVKTLTQTPKSEHFHPQTNSK